MDDDLRRLIRERYPFPIAHAHKKLLSFLHHDAHKLTCLIQTAEMTVQFLALVVLAQLHRDMEHGKAPVLGSRGASLREDYFSALAEFQTTIPDIFTHEMRLARLTQAQALQAAVEPVKRVGLSIDEALVADVILPLLD